VAARAIKLAALRRRCCAARKRARAQARLTAAAAAAGAGAGLATFFAALLSFFADLTGAFFAGAFLAAFLNAIASGCGRARSGDWR
jgi:predicted PurR-regulated permease PerM